MEEFGVRGKFTVLPCPAGHGQIDREVRGYSGAELKDLMRVIRERIAPRMDITPEVLTHTMALDPKTDALLPHAESAWIAYLSATGNSAALVKYIRHGYSILRNAGFAPHGLTIGGMTDPSGIAKNEMVSDGYHLAPIGEALLEVEKEFAPTVTETFLWTGAPPVSERSRLRRLPEVCFEKPGVGRVYAVHAIDDIAFNTLHGNANLEKEINRLVTPDLERGELIVDAEAGKVLAVTLHTQTLISKNTGQGLQLIREVARRLQQRYGRRLVWATASELCTSTMVADQTHTSSNR